MHWHAASVHRDFNVFIFFPGQRQASRGLHLKQSQLQPFCRTEIREKRRLSYYWLFPLAWLHRGSWGKAGRQSNCWTGWKGTVRDLRKWHGNWYREGNWEEAPVFFPLTAWGEACTWSEDRYQGWDVANALPYIPIQFLSLCFRLAYSSALASFWFIWLCFCGSRLRGEALKSDWRTKARCARGAQWAPRLSWELRTDTVVCGKRMSLAANDSYRGDQLLKLQSLTRIQEPWRTDSKIHAQKKEHSSTHRKRDTGSCILKFCLKFQTTLPLMVGALSPICTFARWDVTELKCFSLSVDTQLKKKHLLAQ